MGFKAGTKERFHWKAQPSHLHYIQYYVLYGLVILICLGSIISHSFIALIGILFFGYKVFEKYWEVENTLYILTHERLRVTIGGLQKKRTFDVEKHRLLDIELHQSFLYQIFNLGTLEIKNYQVGKESLTLRGVKDPEDVREIIRGVAIGSDNVSTYEAIEAKYLSTADSRRMLKDKKYYPPTAQIGPTDAPERPLLPPSNTGYVGASTVSYLEAYPNPFRTRTRIRFSTGSNEVVDFTISNWLGEVVLHIREQTNATDNTFDWEAGSLEHGEYMVRVEGAKTIVSGKVVIG